MPWVRVGDNVIIHPRLLRLHTAQPGDTSVFAEAFGFLSLGATMSAAHLTDYRVEFGSWVAAAGGNAVRARELLAILEGAGLVERVDDGEHEAWTIWEDEEFIHLRSKAEVEIDRQRKRDMRNTDVTIAVRVRDGDQCRYCGKTVSWVDRKSGRSATYDHVDGVGGGDADCDGLVVCCRACNTELRGMSGDAKRRMLRPVPKAPHFSKSSASFINASTWATERGIRVENSQILGDIPEALLYSGAAAKEGTTHTVVEEDITLDAGGTVSERLEPPCEPGAGEPHLHTGQCESAPCGHTGDVVVEEDITLDAGGTVSERLEPSRDPGESLPSSNLGSCTSVCVCGDGDVVVEEDITLDAGGAVSERLEPSRDPGESLPSSNLGSCTSSLHGVSKASKASVEEGAECLGSLSAGVARQARRRYSRRRHRGMGA